MLLPVQSDALNLSDALGIINALTAHGLCNDMLCPQVYCPANRCPQIIAGALSTGFRCKGPHPSMGVHVRMLCRQSSASWMWFMNTSMARCSIHLKDSYSLHIPVQ